MFSNDEVLDLAEYVHENYEPANQNFPFWKILSLIDQHRDKIIFVKDGKKFKGAAMYIKLDDDAIAGILEGTIDPTSPDDMRVLLNSQGDNIHFIFVVADGIKTILKGLREVMKRENPYSVTWFNPDMEFRLIKYRRELCQSH